VDISLTLLFQAITAIGVMAYLLDKERKFRNSFTDDWDRFLSKHSVPFYYGVGMHFLLKLHIRVG
jgi:hypothetical protein